MDDDALKAGDALKADDPDAVSGIRMLVAYDGTGFVGWQRQSTRRSVQAELDRAASAICGAPVLVRGASRTDSGVHAEGQVAAFDTPRSIDAHGWSRALNGKLPQDISVRRVEDVGAGYDPRFDATGKTYRYLLHLDATRDPLLRHRAWHLGPRRSRPFRGRRDRPTDWLDLDAMEEAAHALEGEHDFHAFRSARDSRVSTIRTMHEVSIHRGFGGREDLVAVIVRGSAFMQHMVRIVAGTLVDVGRERLSPADVRSLLTPEGGRDGGGETAPAHGLTLVQVHLGRLAAAAAAASATSAT